MLAFMATHSSVLNWRMSWTEKPGGLQPMGLQRVTQLKQLKERSSWKHSESYYLQVSIEILLHRQDY